MESGDTLAVGSAPGSDCAESESERIARLLRLKRSHPTQVKYSYGRVQKHWDPEDSRAQFLFENNIDSLNDIVSDASLDLIIETLKVEYQKCSGKPSNWIDYMYDRDISARHFICKVIINDWRDPGHGGRGRFFYPLVRYAEPLDTYSWGELRAEYPTSESPFEDHLKHICRRQEGQVATAWSDWE